MGEQNESTIPLRVGVRDAFRRFNIVCPVRSSAAKARARRPLARGDSRIAQADATILGSSHVHQNLSSGYDTPRPISNGIRIVGVKNDPDNCRLGIDGSHVFNDTPPKPWGVAYDLETIDTAEVMTLQEGQDLSVAHGLDGPAKLSDGYVIVIDDMPWPFPLSFSNKDTAIRAAQLLRRAGEICRSKPVRLNAVGGPGLSETLLFIQQKLKDEASVVYENQSPGNKNPVSVSSRVANAEADPTSCQIRYKDFEITYDVQGNPRTPREYNFHLLFRYVRKLEVVDYQTFAARLGGPIISAVTPNVYCLIVTGDGEYDFYFRDAEMADRVAKAMNHAAELCGSNKSKETKEPF